MAKGDITYAAGNLAAGASVAFQPAVGKRMKLWAYSDVTGVNTNIDATTDGVNWFLFGYAFRVVPGFYATTGGGSSGQIFADNTKYVRIRNADSAAHNYLIIAIEY